MKSSLKLRLYSLKVMRDGLQFPETAATGALAFDPYISSDGGCGKIAALNVWRDVRDNQHPDYSIWADPQAVLAGPTGLASPRDQDIAELVAQKEIYLDPLVVQRQGGPLRGAESIHSLRGVLFGDFRRSYGRLPLGKIFSLSSLSNLCEDPSCSCCSFKDAKLSDAASGSRRNEAKDTNPLRGGAGWHHGSHSCALATRVRRHGKPIQASEAGLQGVLLRVLLPPKHLNLLDNVGPKQINPGPGFGLNIGKPLALFDTINHVRNMLEAGLRRAQDWMPKGKVRTWHVRYVRHVTMDAKFHYGAGLLAHHSHPLRWNGRIELSDGLIGW